MNGQQPLAGQAMLGGGGGGQQLLDAQLLAAGEGQALEAAMQQQPEVVDPRKLCILGLPWDTSEEMLHSYFSQFGPLEEATIIRKAKTGESRGFGFVTYQHAADAEVVRAREHTVGGRHCDAKQALPRGSANPSRTTRLFIGRVPPRVGDAELRAYFEQFGKVQDAYIPKDPATGKQGHRGFGFVTFAHADDVDKVMACAHSLHQQELAVQCAIPKDKTADAGLGRASRLWQAGAVDSYPSSAESSMSSMVHAGQQQAGGAFLPPFAPTGDYGRASGDFGRPSGEFPRPYVAGDEAHPDGGPSTSGRLHPSLLGQQQPGAMHPGLQHYAPASSVSGGSRRSSLDVSAHAQQRLGSMDRASLDQTVQALQGLTFNGGGDGIGIGLALLHARNAQAQLTQQQQQQLALANASLAAARAGNGAMRPPSQRNSIGAAPPGRGGPADANAGPRIFLGKLNKETTEQDVKDYFTRFGYVLDVYMPRDKVKRSEHRGFGFVTFETEGAVARVAQHGPHQIKGSVIAIDSAVPRREEAPSSEDADDRTPTAAAAQAQAAAAVFNLQANFGRNAMLPPNTSGAAFANGALGSPGGSSYGMNGLASPGGASHPVEGPGSRKVSYEQPRASFEQIRSSLDYGARQAPIGERVQNYKNY